MRALLVTLEAPMRSWGGLSLGDDRGSLNHPTASGMLGFLGACAGIDRADRALLSRWYAGWDVITISEKSPSMMVDYQSSRNSKMADGKLNPNAVISSRAYLLSAIECVAFVERSPSDLFDAAVAGIANPTFSPFVGRRSNPLMAPPRAEVFDCELHSDVAAKLLERWNRETGSKPYQMIAPVGLLNGEAMPGTIRLMKSIPDERVGALATHSSALREFIVSRERNTAKEAA